jgi:preprotein translocase subunit YajC
MLFALLTLFAQDDVAQKAVPQDPGLWSSLPFLLMAVAFIFILFLPARRERQQRAALLAALKKNDEVETAGGIFGVVQSIKDNADEVVLKLEDNAKMRVRKSAIVRIVPKESATPAAPTT